MEPMEDTANPYEPPNATGQDAGDFVCSVRVGHDEVHTVFVSASLWTGLKTHSTSAEGVSGPVYRGPCRFELGSRERHVVEIRVDGMARVNLYVDGQLVEPNVLAQLRAVIFFRVALFVSLTFAAVSVFLYLWIKYEPDKWIDRWIETNL